MAAIDYSSPEAYFKSIGANNTPYNGPANGSTTTPMSWGSTPIITGVDVLSGMPKVVNSGMPNSFDPWNSNMASNPTGGGFTAGSSPTLGGWFDPAGKGGMALAGLQTATGAFNAWMGNKNRKFLEGYYGEQMARQKVDFNNAVGTQNLNMESALTQKAANQGITDPAARQTEVAKGMEQWGAKKIA